MSAVVLDEEKLNEWERTHAAEGGWSSWLPDVLKSLIDYLGCNGPDPGQVEADLIDEFIAYIEQDLKAAFYEHYRFLHDGGVKEELPEAGGSPLAVPFALKRNPN